MTGTVEKVRWSTALSRHQRRLETNRSRGSQSLGGFLNALAAVGVKLQLAAEGMQDFDRQTANQIGG